MGRRSTHTPDQLRQLILDAAEAIIETNGLAGLSAREIARRHESRTFIPALGHLFARNPCEIEVAHEARHEGRSKYSVLRLFRLQLDLMTGFSVAPLQFFSMSGIVIALLSIAFVIYLAIRRLIVGPEAEGHAEHRHQRDVAGDGEDREPREDRRERR